VTVALLLIAIVISFVVVRIGATALELTGLSWDHAKFQALSAFSNAGFTTQESEEIVRHPLRRRIVTYLIVLGNAGLVATVGSFAGTLMQPQGGRLAMNLAMMALGLALLFWVARRPRITLELRERARRWLAKRYSIEMWSAEELLHLGEEYELTRFDVSAQSRAAGHTLRQLQLKQNRVQILAVERGGEFIAVPRGDFELLGGDNVIVYGQRDAVDLLLQPGEDQIVLEVEGADTPGTSWARTEDCDEPEDRYG
jgi:hypothetical protein